MRAMFVLTFSPLGEKVNTIMVLIHQPVKKSTLGKIVKNCQPLEAKTLTFSNADGFEFVTERTFLPPMVTE